MKQILFTKLILPNLYTTSWAYVNNINEYCCYLKKSLWMSLNWSNFAIQNVVILGWIDSPRPSSSSSFSKSTLHLQDHKLILSRWIMSQISTKMPEVRELSEALPEMSMDPITGVGVVASRNRAPTGYDVVSRQTQLKSYRQWNNPITFQNNKSFYF